MELIVNNIKINYVDSSPEDDKSGVVVILQGWGTSLDVYQSVASCIDEKYRVIRLDFPGFGLSDEPPVAWSVDDFTDFTLGFFKLIGIQKATLIGHSYGGRVIIKMAARDDLDFEIEKIVLIDSAGVMPKRSAAQKAKIKRYKALKKMVDNPFVHGLFPDLVDDWKKRQGSEDYRNASPIMRQCLVMAVNEDLTELFPKVNEEVLLIWGDKDTATPIEDAKIMEKKMPNAGLAVIPGTGHYSFLENPRLFRSIMRVYFKMEEMK